MKFFLRALVVLLAWHTSLTAQSHGYGYFGPGAISSGGGSVGRMFLGVGAEGVHRTGLGGGVELGYATPWQRFTSGLGIASLNGSYHFGRGSRLDPFITGGYSLLFRSGHLNTFNVGGGVNYWFQDRLGLKIDFRDHVDAGNNAAVHLWAVRFGVTFR